MNNIINFMSSVYYYDFTPGFNCMAAVVATSQTVVGQQCLV